MSRGRLPGSRLIANRIDTGAVSASKPTGTSPSASLNVTDVRAYLRWAGTDASEAASDRDREREHVSADDGSDC